MWRFLPVLISSVAISLLTGCGGGDSGSGPATGPDETPMLKRAAPLFSADKTLRLRTRTQSGAPGETAVQNDARRRAQDRTGWAMRRAGDPALAALDAFAVTFSAEHADVSLRHPLLARRDIIVHGARSGTTQFLGATMDHAGWATLTTRDIGDGGIDVRTDMAATGRRPAATATWEGLMLGADRDRRNLLYGDTTLTYNFTDREIDIRFTDIIDLDRETTYQVPEETFAGIAVTDDGRWATPTGPRYIEGRFAGPAHQEAVGLFWTPDMMGSFGAKAP
ncbi:MAG: hypothetical protein OXC53_06475 [Rhodobacteraceae bacterium]|nr:hypothetical protein [Paracoccaceae bacterium]